MEKEVKTILPDDEASDKAVKKLLSEGGDIEMTVKGKKVQAYWQEVGFEKRPFVKAHSYRRVKEAEEQLLLKKKEVKNKILVKDDLLLLNPAPSCLSDVKVDGASDYTYNRDISGLYFSSKIDKEIEVSYYTYEEQAIYEEIYYNAITVAMIFYSVKKIDNHKENFFESIDYVGSLRAEDIVSIMSSYMDKVKVTGDEVKKSLGSQVSEEKDATQKDTA